MIIMEYDGSVSSTANGCITFAYDDEGTNPKPCCHDEPIEYDVPTYSKPHHAREKVGKRYF